MTTSPLTSELSLIDHHCHGLIQRDVTEDEFAMLASESEWPASPGLAISDSPFGIAVRRLCAPVLELDPHSSMSEYVVRRHELGHEEANRRLVRASGIDTFLIETGFPTPTIATPEQMAMISGGRAETVIRLEAIAEEVGARSSAHSFIEDFDGELRKRAATAVGVKTIIAYRHGLDIAHERPAAIDVRRAVGEWLHQSETNGIYRLEHPIVLNHLVWAAIDLKTVIQVHVGFGDTDVQLDRANPSLMTPFLRATRESGTRIVLLHCYPYVREAGVLAHLFPHVWFDVSCLSHYAGPSAATMIRHAMEVSPFGKLLFASDAYGIAEHYLVSSTLWRRGMGDFLDEWIAADWITVAGAERIAFMIGAENAMNLYKMGTI